MPSRTATGIGAPRPARVRPGARGVPAAVDALTVESVLEEWVVEDRWWTGRPLRRRYFECVLENDPVVTDVLRDAAEAVLGEGHAIELANGTRYGLQAGIFTRDLSTALDAVQRLEFGGVTVNEAPTFRADQMPYGGVKDSGNTREGPAYAVREFTEDRLVVIDL